MPKSYGEVTTKLECGNNADEMRITAQYKFNPAVPTDGFTPPEPAHCDLTSASDEHDRDAMELLSDQDKEYLQELALIDAENI